MVWTGGAKIWECTQDLGEFLVTNKITKEFSDSKVLDLGCGAGILGILAMQNGAEVHFQDYVWNKVILKFLFVFIKN